MLCSKAPPEIHCEYPYIRLKKPPTVQLFASCSLGSWYTYDNKLQPMPKPHFQVCVESLTRTFGEKLQLPKRFAHPNKGAPWQGRHAFLSGQVFGWAMELSQLHRECFRFSSLPCVPTYMYPMQGHMTTLPRHATSKYVGCRDVQRMDIPVVVPRHGREFETCSS